MTKKKRNLLEHIENEEGNHERVNYTQDKEIKKAFLEGYKEGVKDGFESGFTMKINVCQYCNKNPDSNDKKEEEYKDPGVG